MKINLAAFFAALGIPLLDAEFLACRPRRRTKHVFAMERNPGRRRPTVTPAKLTAYQRARNKALALAKAAKVEARRLEHGRRQGLATT